MTDCHVEKSWISSIIVLDACETRVQPGSNRWDNDPGEGDSVRRTLAASVFLWKHTREQLRSRCERGADPFQQPLQKNDKRGRRGGCDDPNTSQWKWHTGQAWPAPPPPYFTHTRMYSTVAVAGACLRDAYTHAHVCMHVVSHSTYTYLRTVPSGRRCARRWWGEGEAGARGYRLITN